MLREFLILHRAEILALTEDKTRDIAGWQDSTPHLTSQAMSPLPLGATITKCRAGASYDSRSASSHASSASGSSSVFPCSNQQKLEQRHCLQTLKETPKDGWLRWLRRWRTARRADAFSGGDDFSLRSGHRHAAQFRQAGRDDSAGGKAASTINIPSHVAPAVGCHDHEVSCHACAEFWGHHQSCSVLRLRAMQEQDCATRLSM